MPYIPAGRRRAVSILAVLAGAMLAPAAASAAPVPPPPDWIANALSSRSSTPPSCTDPVLSQPFLAWGDQNWYTLAPGESDSNFTGNGWLLLGGAQVTSASLNDGTTNNVLDLPPGSMAISPPMCVAANYPTARMMVQQLAGGRSSLSVFVTYAGTGSWANVGNADPGTNGWSLSNTVQLQPPSTAGWQMAQFALVPSGSGKTEYEVYNFYVDPYAKR